MYKVYKIKGDVGMIDIIIDEVVYEDVRDVLVGVEYNGIVNYIKCDMGLIYGEEKPSKMICPIDKLRDDVTLGVKNERLIIIRKG
jgi:hypothetical protein